MKPRRLQRLLHILLTLRARSAVSVADLATLCGTSRRTIFRDLKELQALGLCGGFDSESGGYTLALEGGAAVPGAPLQRDEALGLLLAQRTPQPLPAAYRRSASLASLKIRDRLPESERARCARLLEAVSGRACPERTSERFDEVFLRLQRAIVERHRVRIEYRVPRAEAAVPLEVDPCRLHFDHPHWYLFAHARGGGGLKVYRLYRIRAVEVLDETVVTESRVDPHRALGRAWGVQPEGRLYHVQLRFAPSVADAVLDVTWHRTQRGRREPDGSARVEFRVDGLREITWWILGYGDRVEVLGPPALRRRILEMARNVAARHRDP